MPPLRPEVAVGRVRSADGAWEQVQLTVTDQGLGWRRLDEPVAATNWIRHDDVRNLDEVADPTCDVPVYELTAADGSVMVLDVEDRFIESFVAFLQADPTEVASDLHSTSTTAPWWRSRVGALVGAGVVVALLAMFLTSRVLGSDPDESALTIRSGSRSESAQPGGSADPAVDPAADTPTTTLMPSTTAPPPPTPPPPPPPPPTVPTTIATTTTIPTVTVSGGISFLKTVGFEGPIPYAGGSESRPAPEGSGCAGSGGYGDLTPGATAIISDETGRALAVVPLGGGAIVNGVRGTQNERREREDLVDSIYGVRVAYADYLNDSVLIAQLNVDRAELRLRELDLPFPQPFEGRPFYASWCRLGFSAPGLPLSSSYTVTIGTRGSNTVTLDQLFAAGGNVELTVG